MAEDHVKELQDGLAEGDSGAVSEAAREVVEAALGSSRKGKSLEKAVSEMLDLTLERKVGTGLPLDEAARSLMEGVLEGLGTVKTGGRYVRLVSEAAVRAVAQRGGNVVQVGKAAVQATLDTAEHAGLDPGKSATEAALGACAVVERVGPSALQAFKREMHPLVGSLDDLAEGS